MAYNSLRWLIDAELPQLREEGREVADLAAHWAMLGTGAIPARWTAPLHDTVETWVGGVGEPRISDLARRTMQVVLR